MCRWWVLRDSNSRALGVKTNALTELKITNEATKATDLAQAKEESKVQKENKKHSDAFKKDLLTIDGVDGKQALIDYANTNDDKFYGDNGVDFESMKFGKDLINKDVAKDTKTKTEIAQLKQAKKDLEWQNKLNKANKKASSKKDDSFKYTEATGAKIKSLLATSMGMDAPNFSMDDTIKKKYEADVAGVSAISKEYKIEPNLALDVYRNKDTKKYIFDKKNKKVTNPDYVLVTKEEQTKMDDDKKLEEKEKGLHDYKAFDYK